ncbi:hypothetical protein ACLMJK_005047 [Lecanora helva]
MEAAAKTFFTSSLTSSLHPVLVWYHARSLPVQPITPSRPDITISNTTYPTIASPSALLNPTETSLSIITPPSITLDILREAKAAGVPAVWLQPGSFDKEGFEYATKEFKAGIGGEGGLGGEGWCVLVDGDRYLEAAKGEREGEGGKL